MDIHIFADLPARTGLGSSSSFTVGFLNALYALEGKKVAKQQLAEEAIYIEQEMIKERVGCQDQFHAAYGGLNIIEFSKERFSLMLRDTPQLKGKVKEVRAKDSNNTIMQKSFPGGNITFAGANSAASLGSRPKRVLVLSEIDR